jgi:hypothetical protein
LAQLLELDYRLAVLSNKPDLFAQKCVSTYFAPYRFDPVFGQRPGVARKPDPQAVRAIMKYHDVSAKQTLFVGDSEIDIQTAQNAGIFSVGVAWGYRSPESLIAQGVDLIIDQPSDLLSFLRSSILIKCPNSQEMPDSKVAIDKTRPKSRFNWKTLTNITKAKINIAKLTISLLRIASERVKKIHRE